MLKYLMRLVPIVASISNATSRATVSYLRVYWSEPFIRKLTQLSVQAMSRWLILDQSCKPNGSKLDIDVSCSLYRIWSFKPTGLAFHVLKASRPIFELCLATAQPKHKLPRTKSMSNVLGKLNSFLQTWAGVTEKNVCQILQCCDSCTQRSTESYTLSFKILCVLFEDTKKMDKKINTFRFQKFLLFLNKQAFQLSRVWTTVDYQERISLFVFEERLY